jgi:thiaminase/transcriptional activator TenA
MGLATTLWEENTDLAEACLASPFVRGIADGSLERTKFCWFIGQDAWYLGAFARAYLLAAAKAPDDVGLRAFHALAAGVLSELELHADYASRWGVDLAAVTPGPATRRYTDFLLATAWGQPVGVIAAAMTPCMRLYAYLGKALARDGIPDHDYGPWIRTYADDAVGALVGRLEQLLERYEAGTEAARAAYRYAMECELAFFEAAWQSFEAAAEVER